MPDLFERAQALIEASATHPDPEAAMEALEREAGPDEAHMFPALWEALVLKLNEAPIEDDQA
ncbi:MAG: hypothetical protein MUE84_10505 [Hyphomonas sp.]|jgi:hypothetical protein|nr:hypothetical protein [Hyphomonas sp.]